MATDNKIKLGVPELSALVILMVENREVSNTEMKALAGIALTGDSRKKLVGNGLVQQGPKIGNAFTHALTAAGWEYCRNLSAEDRPDRAGSAGGALFVLLAGLNKALDRAPDGGRGFFTKTPAAEPTATADIEFLIRRAYKESVKQPGDWVGLADLREALADVDRTALDDELRRLSRQQVVNIIPMSNQLALTGRDRDAALHLGGKANHAFKIEDA
jgi:hypothetical protein